MNTPSDVVAQSESRAEVAATAGIAPAQLLYWSVRRELWENRSIYLAPLAVAAVALAGFLIRVVYLPDTMRSALAMSPMQQHEVIEQPYVIVALMLMVIDMVVSVVYSLDALYGERRDRSVLFWKSLPVSDATVVIAKASIPILVLPLVTCAVTVAVQFIMLVMSSAVLAASGMSPAPLWEHVPVIRTSAINLFHMVAFHGLWYAPLYGWLLMVSAWAKRAPFLWATLPPVAIGLLEKIAFNTSYFATMIQYRFMGRPSDAESARMSMDMMAPHQPVHFLLSPGLWIGLSITGAFLFAAVRLRRWRDAI